MNISHITLIVRDLEKSANMLKVMFDAKEIYSSNGHKFSISEEKFFLIGKTWFCLMEGDGLNKKTYNHIAFKISKKSCNFYGNSSV